MTFRLPVVLAAVCLLAACGPRAAEPATMSPAPGLGSGIHGVVMIGPTCPVERAGAPPCEAPVATTIDITTADGHPFTTVQSGADGTFRVALPPGRYVLTPQRSPRGAGMRGVATTVTVQAGMFADVTLTLDTGIR